jgi:hypothetical protein
MEGLGTKGWSGGPHENVGLHSTMRALGFSGPVCMRHSLATSKQDQRRFSGQELSLNLRWFLFLKGVTNRWGRDGLVRLSSGISIDDESLAVALYGRDLYM